MYLTELHAWQLALLVLPILPNLWALWHASRHNFSTPTEKMGWMLGAVFLPVIGGVAYLLFGRRRATPFPQTASGGEEDGSDTVVP